MAKTRKTKKELTLEESVVRLEEIVEELESGEADLEKSIELYQEGKKLGLEASKKLEGLEQKILKITGEKDGKLETEEFDQEPDLTED